MVEVVSKLSGYETVNKAQRKYLKGGNKMPLTKKGEKIMSAMKGEYGAKKGKKVFYASQNKGTIKGTHKGSKPKEHKKNIPGMSVHPVVNCNEASRRQSMDMGQMRGGEKKNIPSHF